MKRNFLNSPYRFYYLTASFRFLKWPWTIYKIVHSDEYLAKTKQRQIYDDFCAYRCSHKYGEK